MDLILLAQQAIALLNQAEPALSAGAAAVTVGAAAVKVIQKGKQLITFLITEPTGAAVRVPAIGGPMGASPDGDLFKRDVAICVDINRRLFKNVATYLTAQKIDADFFLVTNDPSYSPQTTALHANDPDEWKRVVQEFNAVANQIKASVENARVHIFMSVPLPIAFGLGSVWGTVDNATVYHWQGIPSGDESTYFPVLKVSRALRFGDGM